MIENVSRELVSYFPFLTWIAFIDLFKAEIDTKPNAISLCEVTGIRSSMQTLAAIVYYTYAEGFMGVLSGDIKWIPVAQGHPQALWS